MMLGTITLLIALFSALMCSVALHWQREAEASRHDATATFTERIDAAVGARTLLVQAIAFAAGAAALSVVGLYAIFTGSPS